MKKQQLKFLNIYFVLLSHSADQNMIIFRFYSILTWTARTAFLTSTIISGEMQTWGHVISEMWIRMMAHRPGRR